MGATKIFDIVINSKYTPTGVRGFLGGLSKIGEAGFNIRQGLIAPLQEVGQKVLDFIEIANPERIARLTESFDELGLGIGNVLDNALGPLLDTIGDIVVEATSLININKRLGPVYDDLTERLLRQGKTAVEVAAEVSAASDRAVEAAKRAQQENPFHTIGLNAEDARISTEQFRQILLDSSGTLSEYIDALDVAGIKYADLSEEVDRFNEAQGRVAPTFRDIIAAQQEFAAGIAEISENRLQLEERIGERLSDLLLDQAIRRSDALEDQARRNARRLAAISSTRIEAIQQASEDLTSELADIDSESSRDRIRIEERFQERIRQIKNQFGDQIEEAIRRRDARGLAQALKGQKDQLSQATRDRDKQASDRAEDAGDRQKEAQERQKEQEQQAEEAAARAIEQLQEQTRIADEERNRASRRQQRDQGIRFDRLRRGQARADLREVTELRAQNRKKITEINRYFDEVERIIDTRLAVGGKLAEAIQTAVVTGFDLIFRD